MPVEAIWMDLNIIIVSQEEENKYDIYIWNLKYGPNISMGQKQTHLYTEQTCGLQGRRGMGEGWIGSMGLAEANYCIWDG